MRGKQRNLVFIPVVWSPSVLCFTSSFSLFLAVTSPASHGFRDFSPIIYAQQENWDLMFCLCCSAHTWPNLRRQVVPRNPSSGERPQYARYCAKTEQKDSYCGKDLTIFLTKPFNLGVRELNTLL
ncbi:unnamed protein product [Caretta caretta]